MLEKLFPAAPDPILSLSCAFKKDPRPQKMDLGIGVYKDHLGHTPIMKAVKLAQEELALRETSKVYLGLGGNEGFNHAITELLLKGTAAENRSATIQTPGGTGALRLIGELISLAKPNACIWMSDPSYVNHKPIMEAAGLKVQFYPYFNEKTMQVDVNPMLSALSKASKNDIVLLHGCCHNPTGADLRLSHWEGITELAQKKGFIPFIDFAYQGLGKGLENDAQGVRLLANCLDEIFIATSYSKNFGLYRERVGAAIVVGKNITEAENAKGCISQLARTTYTMPPNHGAAIVEIILSSSSLKKQWHDELNEMRERIFHLRHLLTQALAIRFNDERFHFIQDHSGMFSMLGLSPFQVEALKAQFGIYLLGDSRINIAGLTENSIDYFADAIKIVVK